MRKFKQKTSHLFKDGEKEAVEGSTSIIVEDTTTAEEEKEVVEEDPEPVIIQEGDCLLTKTSGFFE